MMGGFDIKFTFFLNKLRYRYFIVRLWCWPDLIIFVKMNILKKILVFLLSVALSNTHHSIAAQMPVARPWVNVRVGGHSNTVYSMHQDSEGMMWIGSNAGLYSFDGYTTRSHFQVDGVTNSQIYSIIEVGNKLYLGSNNGILIYNLLTGSYEPSQADYIAEIRSMVLDGDELWIGTLDGLYRYNISEGHLQRVNAGLPHDAVYALMRSRNGDIYVGTYDGMCRYDKETSRFVPLMISPLQSGERNMFVNSLVEDESRQCIWIGTEGELLHFDPSTSAVSKVDLLHGNSVKSLALTHDGDLMVGTDNGLFVYNGQTAERYRHDSRLPKTLADNVVWSVAVDRDNNMWVGTECDFSVSRSNDYFEIVQLSDITGRGDGNQIYEFMRDSRGNLWIGGTNGIIKYPVDGDNVLWFSLADKRYHLTHNRVRDIYEDSNDDVWIATDGGVNRYDFTNDTFINYRITNKHHDRNANWSYSIIEDDEHRMWVGSYLGGILIARRDRLVESNGFYEADGELNMSNGGLPNDFVNQMVEDRAGNKWVLLFRDSTVIKVGYDGMALRRYDVRPYIKAYPFAILCDSYNNIWCGFNGGVARLDEEGNVVKVVRFHASPHASLLAMAQVSGELWVSTTDGLWAVDIASGRLSLLPLPNKAYTSIYFDAVEQKILLGSVDELVKVDPSISHNVVAKQRDLYITGVMVNGDYYESEDKCGRWLDAIELMHWQIELTIEFSGLDYTLDNLRHYEYKLEGVDKAWTLLAEGENRIKLSKLTPGNYVLSIRQSGDVASGKDLPIRISPAWYQSWWAMTGYVMLLALTFLWIVKYVKQRNRRRVERMERERTLENVRARMDFLTGISHELKTPLSMIVGPVSKMLEEVADVDIKHGLEAVYKNAMNLNALVHRAIEIDRVESQVEQLLIFSQVDVVGFCCGIFETYKEAHPDKKFLFTSGSERLVSCLDVVKMESIMNNLLSNACKYSESGATISLTINKVDAQLIINISDDGVGIPEKEQQLIFQRMYRSSRTTDMHEGTGIGLYLVKQYVEMHGGSIDVYSIEGEGTTFTLSIPYKDGLLEIADEEVADYENDSRPRVLIVDDNHAIASFIKELLSAGYKCFIAADGRAGLAVCGKVVPDLIIADEMMPVMTGLEMCRRIKAIPKLSSIPIILLTAKDDRATEAESVRAGIDVFMSKPFEAPILMARVRQLMETKAKIRADIRIEQLTSARPIEAESLSEKLLAQVTQVIEDAIAEPGLNVGFVCEATGMHSKQLYRLIKKYVGTTPIDYIRQLRMRKAAMLLEQGKFTVSEVMYMVGFSSSSYFSKCFQSQFGCSPRQYAERQ